MHNPLSLRPLPALRILALFSFFLLSCVQTAFGSGSAPNSFSVSLKTFGVWEPETGERFDFSVWFPSKGVTTQTERGGWVVVAGKGGRIANGFFPLVLLSHDSAGGRFAHNDIAEALASEGMIVIAPEHSGDNQDSSSGLYRAEVFKNRPLNLLRALETILESPDFAPYADESRLGVLGVGVGAITALQLAGAVPDFSGIDDYCLQALSDDAFCGPWSKKRLGVIDADMRKMLKEQGQNVFSPPLDLFAPELIAAQVPEPAEQKKPANTPIKKTSFWQRLFGGGEADAPHEPGKAGEPTQETEAAAEVDAEDASHDDEEQMEGAEQSQNDASDTPNKMPKTVDGEVIFRRPASGRAIKGIALVAPAGGMLFSRESLALASMPIAVVVARMDGLYPPDYHASPYFSLLPHSTLGLELPGTDHFSLFARCTRDALDTIGPICGKLWGDDRKDLIEKRNAFLVPFFQSVLGAPLPVPQPSGFAAVAPQEAEDN